MLLTPAAKSKKQHGARQGFPSVALIHAQDRSAQASQLPPRARVYVHDGQPRKTCGRSAYRTTSGLKPLVARWEALRLALIRYGRARETIHRTSPFISIWRGKAGLINARIGDLSRGVEGARERSWHQSRSRIDSKIKIGCSVVLDSNSCKFQSFEGRLEKFEQGQTSESNNERSL